MRCFSLSMRKICNSTRERLVSFQRLDWEKNIAVLSEKAQAKALLLLLGQNEVLIYGVGKPTDFAVG